MKFLYEYRTKDNVRHEDAIRAASREAAFDALRARGIKPGRLVEAPGFFNKLFGKGKRWIAIAVLGFGCLTLGAILVFAPGSRRQMPNASCPRGQIVGDVAIIAEGVRCGWTNVLELAGDRFLAAYAQPGVLYGDPSAGERRLQLDDALAQCVRRPLAIDPAERIEYRHLKQIVNGMREELGEYLRAGGSFIGYRRRLDQRYAAERRERDRIVRNYGSAVRGKPDDVVFELWQDANARLRHFGLKLLDEPE